MLKRLLTLLLAIVSVISCVSCATEISTSTPSTTEADNKEVIKSHTFEKTFGDVVKYTVYRENGGYYMDAEVDGEVNAVASDGCLVFTGEIYSVKFNSFEEMQKAVYKGEGNFQALNTPYLYFSRDEQDRITIHDMQYKYSFPENMPRYEIVTEGSYSSTTGVFWCGDEYHVRFMTEDGSFLAFSGYTKSAFEKAKPDTYSMNEEYKLLESGYSHEKSAETFLYRYGNEASEIFVKEYVYTVKNDTKELTVYEGYRLKDGEEHLIKLYIAGVDDDNYFTVDLSAKNLNAECSKINITKDWLLEFGFEDEPSLTYDVQSESNGVEVLNEINLLGGSRYTDYSVYKEDGKYFIDIGVIGSPIEYDNVLRGVEFDSFDDMRETLYVNESEKYLKSGWFNHVLSLFSRDDKGRMKLHDMRYKPLMPDNFVFSSIKLYGDYYVIEGELDGKYNVTFTGCTKDVYDVKFKEGYTDYFTGKGYEIIAEQTVGEDGVKLIRYKIEYSLHDAVRYTIENDAVTLYVQEEYVSKHTEINLYGTSGENYFHVLLRSKDDTDYENEFLRINNWLVDFGYEKTTSATW